MGFFNTSFLNQPYPLQLNRVSQTLRFAAIGLFVAFFLIVFQPFGTANVQMPHKNLFLSGYGLISFIVFQLFHVLLPLAIPSYFIEKKWTVSKQLLFIIAPLLLTFLLCYIYLLWGVGGQATFVSMFVFCLIVFSIAIIPIVIITLLDYLIKYRRHAKRANQLMEQLPNTEVSISTNPLQIQDEKQQIVLSIVPTKFFFAKAANNYVEVFYAEQQQLKRTLVRSSLANLERQLTTHNVRRCHRSYLVHLTKINQVTGNAQGYQLHLKEPANVTIPLSRQRGKALLTELSV